MKIIVLVALGFTLGIPLWGADEPSVKDSALKTTRDSEMFARRGGPRGGGPRIERESFIRTMETIKADSPIEYQRIDALRSENPEAFRKALREYQDIHRAQREKEAQEIQEFAKRAREGDLKAKEELYEKLLQGYERRIREAEARIAELEKEINKQRQYLRDLRDKREENIKKIVEFIVSGKGGEGRESPRGNRGRPPTPPVE